MLEEKILKNIETLKATYEAEDESYPVKMLELQRAVSLASDSEKESAVKDGYLPYEDGYIHIQFS